MKGINEILWENLNIRDKFIVTDKKHINYGEKFILQRKDFLNGHSDIKRFYVVGTSNKSKVTTFVDNIARVKRTKEQLTKELKI